MREQFKPLKAPPRDAKPAPATNRSVPDGYVTADAQRVIRRLLRDMRWNDQGGYPSRHNGKWSFVSTGLGQATPKELDMLFKFAGMIPDEIEIAGDCADCANSDNGHERGYAAPCCSCLRPSHINHFVPRENLTKRAK
jgi:hypothetical protein